jgi:hypothetical protein
MGQHPEMGQQDLGCEIGWFRKVGELVGVHVVGYGI